VELQVEKHAIAAADELPDEERPRGGKQLAADLESPHRAAKTIGQPARGVCGGHVERD
jgi:hypothetical protein